MASSEDKTSYYPSHSPTLYNCLRVVRKWRLLNSMILIILFGLLCRTINKLRPVIVFTKHTSVQTHAEPEIPKFVKNIVSAPEAESRLMAEYHQFMVRNKTMIPKIIHQIYRNESIPFVYKDLIKSWGTFNPEYEYWFWDDSSGRRFVANYYPDFLPLYDAYCHDLFRSDALRYFILNEFGGIYIDMDYESLKPLKDLLSDRYFHVVQEHAPQAQLLYDTDDMILNAWIATVPNHPFTSFLINSLASKAKCKFSEVLKSTGPLFVHQARKRYYNLTQCNNDLCAVNILPYTQMMPEWDHTNKSRKHQISQCKKMSKLTKNQRIACIYFRKNQFNLPKKISEEAYATHKFLHLGNEAKKHKDLKGYVNISEIVPKAIFPIKKLGLKTVNEIMKDFNKTSSFIMPDLTTKKPK